MIEHFALDQSFSPYYILKTDFIWGTVHDLYCRLIGARTERMCCLDLDIEPSIIQKEAVCLYRFIQTV